MRVGLLVTCLVDVMRPEIGFSTIKLLEAAGCEVVAPESQTCCGQPAYSAGNRDATRALAEKFLDEFEGFDYIVGPSGSCILHIKEHHPSEKIRNSVYEICEFLVDVLQVKKLAAHFPHRVGLHQSCHGQRGLRLSSMTERNEAPFSKIAQLLDLVDGLDYVLPERADECCGFGGTFCVTEEAVSVRMGQDRIQEHLINKIDYLVGADTSCLMHMEGILRRQQSHVQIKHVIEILNHHA